MKRTNHWVLFYLTIIASVILLAQYGSNAVTVLSENIPVGQLHCIVLDAGHGGVDGGAVSYAGIPESRYNLEITLRLNDLFHLIGYPTKMIRTDDISVYTKGDTIAQKKVSDLKERVRITNVTENALLISIHQNNFGDPNYKGAQVFYSKTPGSERLAEQLQDTFKKTINLGSNRDIKQGSGIYLMEHINCPGILVECGFLSNPQEEASLRNSEYQKKICCVIASTVSGFLSNT